MGRMALSILALSLALATIAPAASAPREPSRNLQKLLDKARLKYQVDDDGDFKITYDLGGGRTQLAYVRSAASEYGSLQLREILSIGYAAKEAEVPADVARRALAASADTKLGAWSLRGRLLIYVSKVPASADARELADAIEFTATVADRFEQETDGARDDY